MATNRVKVFIGNLPFTVTSTDLEKLCSPFGEIIGVNIREDRATGRSRGFAFVTFVEESSAEDAINSLHGQEYRGRKLTVNFATIRGSQGSEGCEGTEDVSWKTAPPTKPVKNIPNQEQKQQHHDQQQQNGGNSTKSKPQPKSWTEWASPPNSEMKRKG